MHIIYIRQLFKNDVRWYFLSSTLYVICIQTKINFVDQNKGKITLSTFPWGRVSLAMMFWFISIENGGKQKVKYLERRNQSIMWWLTQYYEIFLSYRQKCEGFSYPTHFLKSRGSVIRNNFLEYRTKQAILFARRNDFYAFFATNKAKHIHNRHFSCCWHNLY